MKRISKIKYTYHSLIRLIRDNCVKKGNLLYGNYFDLFGSLSLFKKKIVICIPREKVRASRTMK